MSRQQSLGSPVADVLRAAYFHRLVAALSALSAAGGQHSTALIYDAHKSEHRDIP